MLLEEVNKVGSPIGNTQIYTQRRVQDGPVAVMLLVRRADLLCVMKGQRRYRGNADEMLLESCKKHRTEEGVDRNHLLSSHTDFLHPKQHVD